MVAWGIVPIGVKGHLRFVLEYDVTHFLTTPDTFVTPRCLIVGLRPALEGFVVTMHEGACETGSQIPTA